VAVARAVNYRNAGTVEFLRDDKGDFWFIEVNSRLQVEHPVTEVVTGVDLVEEQLRIASGGGIGFSQGKVRRRGAAIQCRINAEDPASGFTPSVGRIGHLTFPGGPGIRVDTALSRDFGVSEFYDSLLAKVIAWGRNLEEARRRALSALAEFEITGIKTNIAFQRYILAHRSFLEWELATDFLNRNRMVESFAEASRREGEAALEEGAAVAAAILAQGLHRAVTFQSDPEQRRSYSGEGSGGARSYDAV
jgi:acetyl/propionyl-CoA carboxylase alpha subunit